MCGVNMTAGLKDVPTHEGFIRTLLLGQNTTYEFSGNLLYQAKKHLKIYLPTPDKDFLSKVLVFRCSLCFVVPCVSSYRWAHFPRSVLLKQQLNCENEM